VQVKRLLIDASLSVGFLVSFTGLVKVAHWYKHAVERIEILESRIKAQEKWGEINMRKMQEDNDVVGAITIRDIEILRWRVRRLEENRP
jgi:hypothetical protein